MAVRIAVVNRSIRPLRRSSLPPRAPAPGGILARLDSLRVAFAEPVPTRSPATIDVEAEVARGLSRVLGRSVQGGYLAPAVSAAFPVRTDGSVAVKPVLRTVDISPNGTSAAISPAQAVLLDVVMAEVGRGRPLLEALEPRSDAVDPNDLQVLKTSITDTFDELAAEICRLDAPRPVRVVTLLHRLNTPPGTADNGALPDLRTLLQTELVAGAPSHDEARQFATIAGVLRVADTLWNAWTAYLGALVAVPAPPEQVLEITLARARALLGLVGQLLGELREGMEAVGLSEEERRLLPAIGIFGPLTVDFSLEELLMVIDDFAGLQSTSLLERLGQLGLEDVADESHRLFMIVDQLLRATRNSTLPYRQLFDPRVDTPLDYLHMQLQAIADLI